VGELDEAFHSPTRLQIAAFLSGCDEATFTAAQQRLGLEKSTLSKGIRHLENSGYVTVRKGYHQRTPRTWISLSAEGRQAFNAHLEALQELVTLARNPPPSVIANNPAR
jgi:DNA-binding MarR family transcriptional regulator